MKRTIALDFDGVIHRYSKGWHDGTAYDVPMEGAFEAIRKLEARGYQVVVFSARPVEDIKAWFAIHWPYKTPVPPITNTKPRAIAYVDDRAVRFTTWTDILNYF